MQSEKANIGYYAVLYSQDYIQRQCQLCNDEESSIIKITYYMHIKKPSANYELVKSFIDKITYHIYRATDS